MDDKVRNFVEVYKNKINKKVKSFMANSYRMSNGERVLKSEIDARVRQAKQKKIDQMIEEYGYVFCEECGVNTSSGPIDCSHDVSVDKCQREGKSELAWDVNNITMRCRRCHQKYDGLDIRSGRIQ